MEAAVNYVLDRTAGSLDLTLSAQRLVAKTQGKGLLDKPKTVDIPLTDLKNFCLLPTIGAQNIVGQEAGIKPAYDYSYNAEFVFSYNQNGKLKKKRVFVNSEDETFQRLLQDLEMRCPGASLLHLPPAEAQKRIGVLSAKKTVVMILALLLGLPIIAALIYIILLALK